MSLLPMASLRRLALPLLAFMALAPGRATGGEEFVARIEMPGVNGRLDHLAIDIARSELLVAALGANEVEVIDLKTAQRVARLERQHEPQGLAFTPDNQRLFVANGEGAAIEVFKAHRHEATLDGLPDADNLRLDASGGRLYVGYSNGLAVLDTATLRLLDRIALPGHPEAFELAADGSRIYVNVPSVGAIVVIDRRTRAETARWPVAPASSNYPMALDDAAHRLFVATRAPAALQVFDTASGRRIVQRPLCADADDLFVDAERRRLYAVCGDGRVDVIGLGDAERYDRVRTLQTAPGARTGLLVPALKRLFVAAPAARGRSAAILVYRTE